MPNRHKSTDDYRYGFQGQEKDDELKGEGNSLNYTFRMHDPRVGRFFAIDPLSRQFAYNSSYAFSENRVIQFNELEGLEIGSPWFYAKTGVFGKTVQNIVTTTEDVTEDLIRNTASAGLTVFSGVFVPIVNQANIIRTEGIHGGGAINKSNYVFEPGIYKLDSNWKIINMGINDAAHKELSKSTVETFLSIIPIEKLAVPIIAKLADKIPARQALMKVWGIASEYVDETKAVYTQTLKEGDVLYQYRIPGEKKGSYYVKSLDVKPGDVGLDPSEYTEIYKVTITAEEIKVLNSTHKKNTIYWKDAFNNVDNPRVTPGGGKQVYSMDLKNSADFQKIEPTN